MGRNYFDLCNAIMMEMYYSKANTFAELATTTEGQRIKQKLNQILTEIVVNDQDVFTFRERSTDLYCIGGVKEYPMVNGFIECIFPEKYPAPLIYHSDWKYLPLTSQGRPIFYWIYNDYINLYPVPTEANDGFKFIIKYLTNNTTIDASGCEKENLELETDEPIIPERHRDVLIYGVCKDLRANSVDPKSDFFNKRYQQVYRSMLSSCRRTDDLPNGFTILPKAPNLQQTVDYIFHNPRAGN